MHRVDHERSNMDVSFVEHLIFQTFTHALWVGNDKPK